MIQQLTSADEDWLQKCYEGDHFWYFMHALVGNGLVWGDGENYITAIMLHEPCWYLSEHSAGSLWMIPTIARVFRSPVFYATLRAPETIPDFDYYAMGEVLAGEIPSWENLSYFTDEYVRDYNRVIYRYMRTDCRD